MSEIVYFRSSALLRETCWFAFDVSSRTAVLRVYRRIRREGVARAEARYQMIRFLCAACPMAKVTHAGAPA